MWIGIVSLFPEMFAAVSGYGITRRAVESGLLRMDFWNPRDFAKDGRKTVDDKPYGGGPGMLMQVQPLKDAINAAKERASVGCSVIHLSPQGVPLDQARLKSLAGQQEMILVAGRYEGIDERLIQSVVNEELSIGDFVLSGGELPAMVLIDGVTRLIPGAVGDSESVERESFADGLLDYPQYTRPLMVDGLNVPEVLMSGDHGKIARWRRMQALGRTYEKRPDLLAALTLGEEDQKLLDEYLERGE